jgi:hypothetical protein
MKHIVFFSSGANSYVAAKLVSEKFKKENTLLVFADTLIEDEDNYRFLHEGADKIGSELIILKDGRSPWEVYKDEKYLGNSWFAPCSKYLKQKICRIYIENNFSPDNCILYLGIDFQEVERTFKITENWKPFKVDYPLLWNNWIDRKKVFEILKKDQINPPRLYSFGFNHANCGGFCVRSGKSQFKKLLEVFPERYKFHEEKEEEFRKWIGKDLSILKDFTLKKLREKIESEPIQKDLFEDWGNCGCFSQDG